jgi:hypothetical protein
VPIGKVLRRSFSLTLSRMSILSFTLRQLERLVGARRKRRRKLNATASIGTRPRYFLSWGFWVIQSRPPPLEARRNF